MLPGDRNYKDGGLATDGNKLCIYEKHSDFMRNKYYFRHCFHIYKAIIRCYDCKEPHITIFNENDKYSLYIKVLFGEEDESTSNQSQPNFSILKPDYIDKNLRELYHQLVVSSISKMKYDKSAIKVQKTG